MFRAKVVSVPISLLDLAPAFLTAAGHAGPPPNPLDGTDLLPLLHGVEPKRERTLFWRQPYGETRKAARKGRWKYLYDSHELLFDLGSDPGETHNLAQQRPDLVAELRNSLARWESEMPEPGAPIAPRTLPSMDRP